MAMARTERQKKYYASEKGMAVQKKWNESEKGKALKKAYANKPESKLKKKEFRLKQRYGINLEEYNKMFINQQGCCAICGKHQSKCKKSLVVDHNHETGKVRGLLCGDCNAALGLFKEDLFILKKAINYLQ